MALVAKQASTRLPGAEVAFVRFLVGIAATALAATRYRLRAKNWIGLGLRGAFGGAAVLCFFTAIEHLPVGIATLLNYTAPVFTALWAALFLGERIGRRAVAALAITTVGVALVVTGGGARVPFGRWTLLGILSSLLSGAAVATIREVRRSDGPWEIFAAFCLVGAAVTAPFALARWVPPSTGEWAMLLLVGALSVIAQIMMTWALRWLPAGVSGILMQLTPVAALALGWAVFDERVAGVAALGAAITLGGVSWGARLAHTAPVEEP
jgi:drug/metabolite transporter (DMT)-like permease